MNKKKNFREKISEKGITLVALVITIVILIILATVTINFAFDENGLIARAEQSKELTEQGTKNEQEALNALDEIVGNAGNPTPEEPRMQVEEAKESQRVFTKKQN